MATGLDAQQKIFAANPDDRRAFEALEEHFFVEGDWESLADLYRARLEAPSVRDDGDRRGALLFRLGQILEERILDLADAAETYWNLARLDPTNRPALRQLRGIYERREQWDMVLQIAELEGATDMPPYERAAFESELGQTWLQRLYDPAEALRAFERALDADPEFPAALEGLADLHQRHGRHAEAAEILERLAARLRGPERAPVWISLGGLYTGRLDNRERAKHCFKKALEDDPFQSPAVEWSLLLSTEDEEWARVAELLEARFDLAAGARHRAAIAVEASQIQLNHLGSRPGARAWVDRAQELAQDELAVLLARADIERADGDDAALVDVLDRIIATRGHATPRPTLLEAAELHAHLGHNAKALAALRRASALPGGDERRILSLRAKLLREDGDRRELAEVLETLTALEGFASDERAAHWRELAGLQEQELGDLELALTSWQQAFALERGEPTTLEALDRLYRKCEDWNALREVLETALEVADDDRAPVWTTSLADLLVERFDDPRRARGLYERALELDATLAPALVGLRRIADGAGDVDLLLDVCERQAAQTQDPELIAELAHQAIPILRDQQRFVEALLWTARWTDRVPDARTAWELRADFEARLDRPQSEVESRRRLARLQTGRERSETLQRQAELHTALGQPGEAASALELALEAEPSDLEIQRALCDAYRQGDRLPELARRLRQLADQLPPEASAEPLGELAELLQDPLGDLDTAIVVRWRLVELPNPPADASERLEALLELAGRYAELAQLLESRRQLLGDETPESFSLDRRRARLLLDSLGHCEEAASILQALHERHPDDEAVLDDLERALRAGDDARGLCDLLARRAGWEADDERRVALTMERALLLEEALEEPLAACELYESVRVDDPQSPQAEAAFDRLVSLFEATGEWERLCELLLEDLDGLPVEARASRRERVAAIRRDRLQDLAGCAEQLEAIAPLVSDRLHIWQQLLTIYGHELDRPADWLRVAQGRARDVAGARSRVHAAGRCGAAAARREPLPERRRAERCVSALRTRPRAAARPRRGRRGALRATTSARSDRVTSRACSSCGSHTCSTPSPTTPTASGCASPRSTPIPSPRTPPRAITSKTCAKGWVRDRISPSRSARSSRGPKTSMRCRRSAATRSTKAMKRRRSPGRFVSATASEAPSASKRPRSPTAPRCAWVRATASSRMH